MTTPFPPTEAELTRLLVVSDMGRSLDWYQRVLGATLEREYGGSSAVLRIVGQWLLLVTGGGPTPDKPTVTFAPPPNPAIASTELIFRVPDCHAAYEELGRRGADFLAPPSVSEWEIRAFFRDPDGHLFEISEVPG